MFSVCGMAIALSRKEQYDGECLNFVTRLGFAREE